MHSSKQRAARVVPTIQMLVEKEIKSTALLLLSHELHELTGHGFKIFKHLIKSFKST